MPLLADSHGPRRDGTLTFEEFCEGFGHVFDVDGSVVEADVVTSARFDSLLQSKLDSRFFLN